MLTEQNYPLLKYLHWHRAISEHPEIISVRNHRARHKGPCFGGIDANITEADLRSRAKASVVNGIGQMLQLSEQIDEEWPELSTFFSSRIEVLSETFMQAFYRSYDCFLSLDLFKELEGGLFSGTVIMPHGSAICYDFMMVNPRVSEDGHLLYSYTGTAVKFKDGNTIEMGSHRGTAYMTPYGIVPDTTPEVDGLFDFVLVLTLFKKYAKVEEVDARSVRKDSPEKTAVKSFNDVTLLSCDWYTTIVRTEGFGVKGHFRMQACGKGYRERRLTYINEYRKHGYIRRAKLLVEADKGEL